MTSRTLRSVLGLLGVGAGCASLVFLVAPSTTAPSRTVAGDLAGARQMLSRLPVAFLPNVGQWEHSARFVARFGAMTVFLEEKGWTFTLRERTAEKGKVREEGQSASTRGVAVRMTVAGAGTLELAAEDQLPGRHHYFLGNEPSRWRSNVPLYGAVRYRQVHPGIDLRAREQAGHFEYDLLLQPGADLDLAEIAVEGSERMHVDGEGALVLETRLGPVRMTAPLSWEEGPAGERSLVTCRYVLRGENRIGFEVTGRRRDWSLVVDPGLVWSTFLGGSRGDAVSALAVDAQGAATVAGVTWSNDFPTTAGAFDTGYNGDPLDTFVTRLSPTGSSLVYSTFLGGRFGDYVRALAVDAQGAATVAGSTSSSDFPTTPGAFDRTYDGGSPIDGDAFVTRLSATGSSLVYSTFLGGTRADLVSALVLDAQGATTVAGTTNSTDFPTTPGAFDTSHNGGLADAFITRLSPTGSSLIYSTFLGGTRQDEARAVALEAQGGTIIAGRTESTDFPTTPGAFDTSHNGGLSDAFVTRLSATGSSLVYSTFLGGAGDDEPHVVAVDAQGTATVAGWTQATNFPATPGAFDTTFNGGGDAFVTQLSTTGSNLVYSTFLGGTGWEAPYALALDAQGAATVAGNTFSTNFPTTPGAFDTTLSGSNLDAFVTRLSPTGSNLVYSTFLGGAGDDGASALALDAHGAATVVGFTESSDFPATPGAWDMTHNGSSDAFVTRLDMLPTGVTRYGTSSPGCTGPLAISVTSMPNVGNATFALTCGNAPPSSAGVVPLTGAGLTTPLPMLGVDLWVDPFTLWFPPGVTSNSIGATELPLPVPQDPTLVGGRIYAQFVWIGPTSPAPCPPLGVSASTALQVTIQP